MDIRRVQKTGASTMTVSLPKDWIEANSIKPGTPVVVRAQSDGTICIDPNMQKGKEESRKVIMVEEDETREHLTRKLIGAYLAGYNIIEVRSKGRLDLELKHGVKEISRLVIGPEVIEETSNTIVLHDLSDPVELPQEKCVRRMHLIVDSMHKDAITALKDGDDELAEDVIDRDADVDRLYWMAVKQYNLILKDRKLSERIGVDIYGGMSLMLVARGIERIGDHAEKIANNSLLLTRSSNKIGDLKEIGELSEESIRTLDIAMQAFFLKDIAGANEIIDRGDELVQRCQEMGNASRTSGSASTVVRTSVLDSIIRTTMYAMDIAEVAINGAMRIEDKSV